MSAAVIVPYMVGSDAHRERNFDFVMEHYDEAHANWQLFTGFCEAPFSKGRAVRDALERGRTEADVLVIADADSLTEPKHLRTAVRWVEDRLRPWVCPHGSIHRLLEDDSASFMEWWDHEEFPNLNALTLDRTRYDGKAYNAVPGGGIVVVPRETYVDVRGFDERFEGWGGEDVTLGWTLHRLHGKAGKLGAPLVHLWHPPASPNGRGSPEAEALVERYRRAAGDATALRALIAERPEL